MLTKYADQWIDISKIVCITEMVMQHPKDKEQNINATDSQYTTFIWLGYGRDAISIQRRRMDDVAKEINELLTKTQI